jgi:hypothetical protein
MAGEVTVHDGGPKGVSESYDAGGAIDPGMLVEYSDADTVVAHSADAGVAQAHFADEKPHGGDPEADGDPIDDGYAAGDYVYTSVYPRGSRVTGRLAADQDVSPGDKLVSDGNGRLRAFDPAGGDAEGAVVARAREGATTGAGETVAVGIEVI